ncbi:hypothetical protein ACHAW5_011261 [Stephanodiscus triporus]|uniref:Fe2OG dioxygenase domain-containing protein n=1 Tax=Stephanodiscus triporus TaxID=2934178 RepID=A0ABD3PPA8_9STRA
MSAFLLSVLSRHDDALTHLRRFQLSHRVHPNVWTMAGGAGAAQPPPSSSHDDNDPIVCGGGDCAQRSRLSPPPPTFSADFLPRIYCGWRSDDDGVDGGGVLPPELHRRLCALFKPGAPYWKESDYDNRGYYSYFLGLNDDVVDDAPTSVGSKKRIPTNVIEDVIFKHLLPLAERSLRENKVGIPSSSPPRIVGAEWWVHTRPVGANLGHQVHFDTDESLLNRERKVTHPIVSSVLYLTGAGRDREVGGNAAPPAVSAGSTVVFDQTPESTDVASRAWVSHPRDNAFMVFPGNLLHGVLPCTAAESLEVSDTAAAADRGKVGCGGNDKEEDVHRLTFMVGFWTRDVREGMGERELYTPCGPMPPPVSEHSWLMQARQGYCENKTKQKSNDDKNGTKAEQEGRTLMFDVLPSTSPAWDDFSSNGNSTLTIPKGLDHRFFVLNAPHCFSESLYEKGDLF